MVFEVELRFGRENISLSLVLRRHNMKRYDLFCLEKKIIVNFPK